MSGIVFNAKRNIKKPSSVRCYGAAWDGGSSTQFTRLDDAVGFADPVPAVGTGAGSSPFDEIMPWAGMKEFNVINGEIAYEKGVDPSFSRTQYDTVVRIPKFWYKVEAEGTKWSLHIADGEKDGYSLHPAFLESNEIYVGKYLCGEGYVSRSAVKPENSISRVTVRSNARNKGPHWGILNIAAWSALTMLFLVEYADWNSQAVVGQGYISGSAAINCGGTDSMMYHTGRPVGTDGNTSTQYRGIEDLWGNLWQWVDGINFYGTQAYYCLDRANFGDDKNAGYTQLGYSCCAGDAAFPKSHGLDQNAPWLFLPTTSGGSNSTYIPDGWWTSTGWNGFMVGGSHSHGSSAGLVARAADSAPSAVYATFGGRLLYIP